MSTNIMRIISTAFVLSCILSAAVYSKVVNPNCPKDCPYEFELVCGYDSLHNCYVVFKNLCELDMYKCQQQKFVEKMSMESCDNPALWCESKMNLFI